MAEDDTIPARRINRRRLLQGMGAAGVVGVAGCIGGNGDDDDPVDDTADDAADDADTDDDDDDDDEPADLSGIQEGGTLRIAEGANIDSFDPPYSTDTTSSSAQFFVFEGLTVSDKQGNYYPWLAESYELVETNDIDRMAYEEYMISVPADEEGALDTEGQVIVQHPEDDPIADDEVRVLTTEEAGEAVADGVFGMQYRYELREGVEFHNGEELSAEHVVATARRYENSDVSAQTFDSVLYVEEEDEYTVSIYAQVPDAEGEGQLPGFYIHSMEQAELAGGELDPRQDNVPIGTGPYELVEFEDEQFAEYEKFDGYWLEDHGVDSLDWFEGSEEFPDGPVIDEIEIEIVPDDATRAGALQNDEIDVTSGLATATLDDFDASDDFVVETTETGGYTYIQYPVNIEPYDDERLRQAINHLVPRQQIVDTVLNGWGRPAWTDIPELAEESGTADPEALEERIRPLNEFDPDRADELLEEVGDDLGLDYPLEVQLETNADNDDRVQLVELIAASMEESGYFETSVETFEWNQYIGRVLDPEYPQEEIIPCIGLSGTFNPESFCDALHNTANIGQCCNLTGISDEEFDEMVDAARFDIDVVEDEELRAERYDEIWDLLAERRYSSITHFGLTDAIMNTEVQNFGVFPFPETMYSFALHAPQEEQVIWLEREDE